MPEGGDRLGRSSHGARGSLKSARLALGEAGWAAVYDAGQTFSSAEAIAKALDGGESQD